MYPFNVARPARAGITCGILGLLRLGLPSMSPAQLGRELPGIADADGETLGPSMSPAQLGRELRQVGVWCDSGRIAFNVARPARAGITRHPPCAPRRQTPSMSPAQLGRELPPMGSPGPGLAPAFNVARPARAGITGLDHVPLQRAPAFNVARPARAGITPRRERVGVADPGPSMSPAQLGRELHHLLSQQIREDDLQCRPPSSGGNYSAADATPDAANTFNVARPARAGITCGFRSRPAGRVAFNVARPARAGITE